MINCLRDARFVGAMSATIEIAARFNTMSDDPAAAVPAGWSQFLNGALEAVKGVFVPIHQYFKAAFIVIAAYFT